MCGTWARLPRKYRRILRAEELRISLTYPEGVIVGAVKKYYGLTSELFSGNIWLKGVSLIHLLILKFYKCDLPFYTFKIDSAIKNFVQFHLIEI